MSQQGSSQRVDGTLTGADASKSSDLQLDAEGGVQQKSRKGAAVPPVLTFLAGRALDEDGSSRYLSAGIGFYAAALSFYERWVARGHDVVFRKDTRIEVTTLPSRSLFHAAEVQQPPSIDR
jgi:hypothetical protein